MHRLRSLVGRRLDFDEITAIVIDCVKEWIAQNRVYLEELARNNIPFPLEQHPHAEAIDHLLLLSGKVLIDTTCKAVTEPPYA
jgi:hypothetical protein